MSFEFIQAEVKDHVLRVTLNRPERMNALHPPAHQELNKVFNDFAEDPDQWIALVTGAGERAFSAGNDLKYQAVNGSAKVAEGMKGVNGGFGGLANRYDCFKPIVAAVNGFALGGGFEIVLSCDVVIASEKATFGLPEPRVGLMAGAGGVHRLPRRIAYHQAMGMMLTGRHISAQEAQNLGLVNEVTAPEDLMPAAQRWIDQILECSPLSIRASKEATMQGLHLSVEDAMKTAFPQSVVLRQSEDFVEGPKAFAEKRKPNWKGK